MKKTAILKFLSDIEKLKSTTRHSWTSTGRHESVAEHSWRMAVMAMLMKDEFPDVEINKVIEMSLIHDFGEVFDGDVPAFHKTEKDEANEKESVKRLVKPLSETLRNKITSLWNEFEACETKEARLANALDKIEVIIQHNEADISTWIPLEHELNLTYGEKNCEYNEFLKEFRKTIRDVSVEKIMLDKEKIV